MENKIHFPVYRKYAHNRTFFKITSAHEFEELQIIGHSYSIHHIKAKILPDRNFISDMLFDYQKNWQAIEQAEYENKLRECEEKLKKR